MHRFDTKEGYLVWKGKRVYLLIVMWVHISREYSCCLWCGSTSLSLSLSLRIVNAGEFEEMGSALMDNEDEYIAHSLISLSLSLSFSLSPLINLETSLSLPSSSSLVSFLILPPVKVDIATFNFNHHESFYCYLRFYTINIVWLLTSVYCKLQLILL